MKRLLPILLLANLPCWGAYGYYQTFTSKSAQVPGSLASFPALISGTYAMLKTTGNGGRVTSSSGYDIAVYDNATCAGTKYDSELVPGTYVASTGYVELYFRIPSMTNAAQVFYLCAGNASITSTQNVTGTWTSGYKYVIHMQETTGTTLADSTSNGVSFTKPSSGSPSVTSSGKISGAQAYNGSSDYISSAATINLTSVPTISISSWVKWTTNTNDDELAMETSSTFNSSLNSILIDPNESGSGKYQVAIKGGDDIGHFNTAYFTRPTAGSFHHFVFVLDKTQATPDGQIVCYVDGALQTVTQTQTDITTGDFGNYTWYLMSRAGAALFAAGTRDETRLYLGTLSANWITTEYNNQSDPANFWTVGAETAATAGGSTVRRNRVIAQ